MAAARWALALRAARLPVSARLAFGRYAVVNRPVPRWTSQVRCFANVGDVVEVVVTDLGAESITEGTLIEYTVAVGDSVKKDQAIAVIETDKVSVDAKSAYSGKVLELLQELEANVVLNQPLIKLEVGEVSSSAAAAKPAGQAEAAAPQQAATQEAPATATSPFAAGLRAAQEQRRRAVSGEAPAAPAASAPSAAPVADNRPPPRSVVPGSREEHRVPLTPIRKRIATRLKETQKTMALLTSFNEVDMSNALALQKEYSELFEKTHGVRLTITSLVAKAMAAAAQEVPAINNFILDNSNEVLKREYVDISVNVPGPDGDAVVVLRDVEKQSLEQVEKTLHELSEKVADGSLAIEDMVGGTIAVQDFGPVGALVGMPILTPPQSVAIAIHAINDRAVMVDGKMEIRPQMYVTIGYDHRLVDGREAATFLVSVKEKLQDPRRLVLNL
mmetsp:Transcript_45889/g.99718  ORF Transcript_45889/g.99718 Transcript_45889/m.99718 type:complete len:445 (-) Transcript_45889:157-1491(-)